jgi:hypothetical protein
MLSSGGEEKQEAIIDILAGFEPELQARLIPAVVERVHNNEGKEALVRMIKDEDGKSDNKKHIATLTQHAPVRKGLHHEPERSVAPMSTRTSTSESPSHTMSFTASRLVHTEAVHNGFSHVASEAISHSQLANTKGTPLWQPTHTLPQAIHPSLTSRWLPRV